MLHSQAVETLYKAMLARLEVRVLKGRRERGENGCYHLLTLYNIGLLLPPATVSGSCS